MAFLAVNKNGTEIIAENEPYRVDKKGNSMNNYFGHKKRPFSDMCEWIDTYDDSDEGPQEVQIEVPKGTIKKLIGKDLKWEDNPVNLYAIIN